MHNNRNPNTGEGSPITPPSPFHNSHLMRLYSVIPTRASSNKIPTGSGNSHAHWLPGVDTHLDEWFLSHLKTHHTDIDRHLQNHEYSQNINQNPSNEPNWLPGLVGVSILIGFLGIAWGVF